MTFDMNKDSMLPFLKKLYGASAVPSMVICGEERWENEAFRKFFLSSPPDEKEALINKLSAKSGTVYEASGMDILTANVISCPEATVMEIIRSEPVKKILGLPAMRDFLRYIFSELRHTVSILSVSADEIYSLLSSEEPDMDVICERLNSIDSGLMSIIGAILDPEQFYYLIDESCPDSTVCIKDELDSIIKDTEASLQDISGIEYSAEAGIYSRLNRPSFKLLISDMLDECFRGEYLPDKLNISLHRDESGCAEVRIATDCTEKRPVPQPTDQLERDSAGRFRRCLFFEYICDVFCSKYGGSFTKRETDCGMELILTFPLINPPKISVSSPFAFNSSGSHFSPVKIRLHRLESSNRYTSEKLFPKNKSS